MDSIPTSGVAWIATAGVFTCCSAVFATFFWRSAIQKSSKQSAHKIRRSIAAMTRAGRGSRLKRYENIAQGVVSDVEAALQPPLCHRHARSFLPILADVRKRGQALLNQQTMAHRVSSPERERNLNDLVMRLFSLESRLKALPKPTVTIEEVLSGKFE